jgi:hypothetical protein
VATPQELPGPLQVVTDEAQVLATGSHDCEQHWAFDAHVAPATVQIMPAPPPPPVPPCPDAPTPPVPVLIAFTELLPQLGRTSSAASSRAKATEMEIHVGESFIKGRATSRAKRLTALCEPFSGAGESILLEWAFP